MWLLVYAAIYVNLDQFGAPDIYVIKFSVTVANLKTDGASW